MTWQNQQSDCAPSEDSDQPGHSPSLIRVFTVCMKKAWVLSYPLNAQRRLWSDWADAQADLSFRWALSHFVGFVMWWLIFFFGGGGGRGCTLLYGKTTLFKISGWFLQRSGFQIFLVSTVLKSTMILGKTSVYLHWTSQNISVLS